MNNVDHKKHISSKFSKRNNVAKQKQLSFETSNCRFTIIKKNQQWPKSQKLSSSKTERKKNKGIEYSTYSMATKVQ